MSAERLTIDEASAMLDFMAKQATRDCNDIGQEGSEIKSAYWAGWVDGLRTLEQHIRTGVKATCFPLGSCTCHPVKIEGRS